MRNPAARLQVGADIKSAIVQFDAEMGKVLEYRAGPEQIPTLIEPLIYHDQMVIASGRVAPITVGEPSEHGCALGTPCQIDDPYRQISATSRKR